MISVTDLRAGKTFLQDGKPCIVTRYEHKKLGRGNAVIKTTVRNIITCAVSEIGFNSGSKVEEINTVKRQLQYLYHDQKSAVFMDPKSYEQIEIPLSILGDQILFVKEGGNATILFWSFGGAQDKEDKALSIEIPPKVTFVVRETDPGVKGNS